jgi:hypothetical protein
MRDEVTAARKRLSTPRAAALAGIVFAVLFAASMVLIALSVPTRSEERSAWSVEGGSQVSLALSLMPFSGIAFLWFMGVVRDRLGELEDQLFATVFFGSGLLFLAMIFIAAALAGGILASYRLGAGDSMPSEVYTFGRTLMAQIFGVYALRMAGVFMISLGTIWMRTGVMPRWLSVVTYLLALVLLLSFNMSVWMILIFPGWVFVISLYILVQNLRRREPEMAEGIAAGSTG